MTSPIRRQSRRGSWVSWTAELVRAVYGIALYLITNVPYFSIATRCDFVFRRAGLVKCALSSEDACITRRTRVWRSLSCGTWPVSPTAGCPMVISDTNPRPGGAYSLNNDPGYMGSYKRIA